MTDSRASFSIAAAALARAQAVAGLLHSRESRATAMRLVGAAAGLKAEADRLLATSVEDARRAGATWQEVGDTLKISRQAAYQRFGQALDPRTGKAVAKDVPAAAIDRAIAVFAQLSAGDPAAVVADFDDQMTSAMTSEALGDTWASVLAAVGSLEKTGEPASHRVSGLVVIDVPLTFEAGEMIGKVSIRDDGRIAGLFILNAPESSAGGSA
ncbi:DUF3887 domain-containing protein [Microbacterium foliorum]|nr:DUF3887 domain-containing protein [Microbacterium foliorum]AXL10875.1 DUF3887 domain-containing protein [Microbacterium foliorum]